MRSKQTLQQKCFRGTPDPRRLGGPIRSSDYLDEKNAQYSGVTLRMPIARRDTRRPYPEWAEDVL
jgi:hypothetical protein